MHFDNAATSHKPQSVLDAQFNCSAFANANVHRSSHELAASATEQYEKVREQVRGFINAAYCQEIIWTKGATESINLLASVLQRGYFKPGDEIVISGLEHHANIVPWQQVAEQLNLVLRVMPLDERGVLDLPASLRLINSRTRLLAVAHVSNALGNINPVAELVAAAKQVGALTLLDGAQAVAHFPVDVQALGCDFYVFSGHKMYAPNGVGVLYGKRAVLEPLPVYQSGGEMIHSVSFSHTEFAPLPYKYEAGTPNVPGVLGLGQAICFIEQHREAMQLSEQACYQLLYQQVTALPGLRVWGCSEHSVATLSFTVDGLDNQDIGLLLNQQKIAIRVGHHCAMPLMQHLGVPGTLRVSLACYNNEQDVKRFVAALKQAIQQLSGHALQPATPQPVNTPLINELASVKGWEARYRCLMLAGKGSKGLSSQQRQQAQQVFGCESQVWLLAGFQDDRLWIKADSPSKIVRGLLVLIAELLSGKTPEQVARFDMSAALQALQLDKHLSVSRGNGVRAVVEHIQQMVAV